VDPAGVGRQARGTAPGHNGAAEFVRRTPGRRPQQLEEVEVGGASQWRPSPRVLVQLVTGLWVFGTGEALLVASALGNSPWTVLAEGVSVVSPLSIGVATIVISGLVLLGWIPLRVRPGLGTVLNAVLIGLAIDVMLPVVPEPEHLGWRLAEAITAITAVGIGSGLYLSAALGPGPRDGWMTGLHRRFGWPVWRVRTGIEAGALALGWLLGGTVGVGTLLFAALVGPAVATGLRVARFAP